MELRDVGYWMLILSVIGFVLTMTMFVIYDIAIIVDADCKEYSEPYKEICFEHVNIETLIIDLDLSEYPQESRSRGMGAD